MQNQSQLVFVQPPPNFNPKVEVAACFIHVEDQVLFLKRQPHKTEGDMWGIPGGRLEKGESAQEAVIREIQEETSLELSSPLIKSFGKVYIRYTHVDFIYHMFEYRLKEFPAQIKIDPIEHTEYRWMCLKEALLLPLIPGEDECIFLSYGETIHKLTQKSVSDGVVSH